LDIRPPFKINLNPPSKSFHTRVLLPFFSQTDIIAQVRVRLFLSQQTFSPKRDHTIFHK
jgi:hypothetical protein